MGQRESRQGGSAERGRSPGPRVLLHAVVTDVIICSAAVLANAFAAHGRVAALALESSRPVIVAHWLSCEK